MMKEAKALGDRLVVIINNDNWLMAKKGFVFMPEGERLEVIKAIRYVDDVVLSSHSKNPVDMSVSQDLEKLKPDIFANGGDRDEKNANDPNSTLYKDIKACEKIGAKIVYNVGHSGKIQSSSDLVKRIRELKDIGEKKF